MSKSGCPLLAAPAPPPHHRASGTPQAVPQGCHLNLLPDPHAFDGLPTLDAETCTLPSSACGSGGPAKDKEISLNSNFQKKPCLVLDSAVGGGSFLSAIFLGLRGNWHEEIYHKMQIKVTPIASTQLRSLT